jgi:hypothetical protein
MAAATERLYVLALAGPGLPRRLQVSGRRLHLLTAESIDVVVERRQDRPDATPAALREQHAIVTSLASRTPALLPVRFGSLLNESDLRSIVAANKDTIAAALAHVRDRVQMTVRVFGDPDPGRPTDDRTSGAAFLASRRRQAQHVPAEARAIRRGLGDLASDERLHAGEGGLRLSIYHLVPRASVEEYRRRASSLQPSIAPYRVAVSGPWPVFAFSPELL